MATPPLPPTPNPTPAPVTAPSKLTSILSIIQLALTVLQTIPVIGGDAALANSLLGILTNALNLYQAEAGVPLDLTKIPLESLVP
jgi:hypothetical protein